VKKLPVNLPAFVTVQVGFATILLDDEIVHVPALVTASKVEKWLPDTVTRTPDGPEVGLSEIVGGTPFVTVNMA